MGLLIRTFHPIPTQMPFQAVFMRGGAGHACMDDLVVRSITAHRKPPDVGSDIQVMLAGHCGFTTR